MIECSREEVDYDKATTLRCRPAQVVIFFGGVHIWTGSSPRLSLDSTAHTERAPKCGLSSRWNLQAFQITPGYMTCKPLEFATSRIGVGIPNCFFNLL